MGPHYPATGRRCIESGTRQCTVCVTGAASDVERWLLSIMRPQGSIQWFGDTVGVVPALGAVVVVAKLRVPMRGQCVSVGWSRGTTLVRTRVIWLKVGDGVGTGVE